MSDIISTGPIGQVPFGQPWRLPGGIGAGELGEYIGNLTATPVDYGRISLRWTLPGFAENIDRFAVVRAGFGPPVSRYAGVTVIEAAVGDPVRTTNDASLHPGRWYYYSLFVRDSVSERWVRVAVAMQIAVRDWGYHKELWAALPRFYRALDQRLLGTVAQGPLYRFMKIFAFELDLLRSMATGTQQMRSMQDVSSRMLESFSFDLNTPYERTLGDAKMRGVLDSIMRWRKEKGTAAALTELVQTLSGCAHSTAETVPNILLTHNDSGWEEPTIGNWMSVANATLSRQTDTPVPRSGVAYLQVISPAAADTKISHSSVPDIKLRGVKVTPGEPYCGSIYSRANSVSRVVSVDIEWYDKNGVFVPPIDVLNTNVVGPVGQVVVGQVYPRGPYGPDYGAVTELGEFIGPNNSSDWTTRPYKVRMCPPNARFARMVVMVDNPLANEVHHFDEAQLEMGFAPTAYQPARKVVVYSCGGRTNMVTNPTLELNTAGWTAVNTTLFRDSTFKRFSTYSLRISPTAGGPCSASTLVSNVRPGQFYTFSIHALSLVTGTISMEIDWLNDANAVLDTTSSTAAINADATHWKRPWVTGVGPEGTTKAVVRVGAGQTLNIDGVLMEVGTYVQDFFDGSFLGEDYFWAGDPHASESLYMADREVFEAVLSRYMDTAIPASTPWEITYTAA